MAEGVKKTFFECHNCRKLIINENIAKFHAEDYQKICFDCIVKKDRPEQCLKEPLRSVLSTL
jgi:deoxycytidylate deaminase